MSSERHYYSINVSQSQTVDETFLDWTKFSSPPDLLRVEFKLFESVESVWVTDDCDVGIIHDQVINLKCEKPMKVSRAKLFSEPSSSIMCGVLSGIPVPEDEQPHIIRQIYLGINGVLAEKMVIRGMPDFVLDIYDVTLKLQNINDDEIFFRKRD